MKQEHEKNLEFQTAWEAECKRRGLATTILWSFREDYRAGYTARDAAFERMRTALEFYADEKNWRLNRPCDPNSHNFKGISVAANALTSL